ncbi:uncharacterized protein LOC135344222 [Halichondria panicea]|uniref:uncharacterized protein LOC135344222 n=1 Tax=Halichondria panicea TaxID=6063 RepID=UPI00312B6943
MDLLLVFCVLLLSIDKGQCNHFKNSCGETSDIGNIRLVEPRHTLNDGTVQICNLFIHNNNVPQITWCYLNSTESWNTTAARVACRQLGLPHSAPTVTMITLQPVVQENIVIGPVTCSGTEVNEVIAFTGTLPVMSTSGTLGALIGLLAAALVVVVTGWIVSCVYLQRKINRQGSDHTHSTPPSINNPVLQHNPAYTHTTAASTSDPTLQRNPVYDWSTTAPHTTNMEPSYEVVSGGEGVGHSYDVISPTGARNTSNERGSHD